MDVRGVKFHCPPILLPVEFLVFVAGTGGFDQISKLSVHLG